LGVNEKMLNTIQTATVNPTIEFRNGQALLRAVSESGATLERFISMEAVRGAATRIPIDSGWLAPEIVRWGTGGKGEWVIAFVPPQRHTIEVTNGIPGKNEVFDRLTVPLPGIVVFGSIFRYTIWSLKTDVCDPQAVLYRVPLPNVYQDGLICWGTIKPPAASSRTIMQVWTLFISSTFNNHMTNGKSKSKGDDVRELLRQLSSSNEERFPNEDLIRLTPQDVSLDKALREILTNGRIKPGE
jgi:hypothetical protein